MSCMSLGILERKYWRMHRMPAGVVRSHSCWISNRICYIACLLFFQTAIEQFQEDNIHSHHHYGQTLKKIVINHFQLLGLATGFSLRWPRHMSNYFRFLNGIGSASEYFFNPSCSALDRSRDTPQTSTFFFSIKRLFCCFQ